MEFNRQWIDSTTVRIAWLLVLVGLAVLRSWYGTRLDSFNADEPYHIVSGISYVQTGDFRLNPEHPPLTKLWVGLWQSDFMLRQFKPLNDKYEERNFLEETMYFDNDYYRSQSQARAAMWVFNGTLTLCLLLLVWHVWTYASAVIVGVFLALEPSVSTHMPVVMTDLPLSLSLAVVVMVAIRFAIVWSWTWTLVLGLATGVALGSKFSAIPALLALYIALSLIALKPVFNKHWKTVTQRLGKLTLAGLIGIVLLWSCYGFQNHATPDGTDPFNRTLAAKIDDLSTPALKSVLNTMDHLNVLPKPYLWGLADTAKAGVEGRGRARTFIYGTMYKGEIPWFYWPSILLSKLPIPLLLLFVISVVILLYQALRTGMRNQDANEDDREDRYILARSSLIIFALLSAYLVTLMSSQATYGGIRHAMPLVLMMALLIGLAASVINWHRRIVWIPMVALFSLTLTMTITEKRTWEYHNETVGGTENAYRYFVNEGLGLSQRLREIKHFIDENNLHDEPFYRYLWLIEEEIKAENLNFPDVLSGIDDDNVEGIWEGYFVMSVTDLLPWEGWDPAMLDQLEHVTRIGNVFIMKGRYVDPMDWARAMRGEVRRYTQETEDPDWQKIALRLEQVTAMIDYRYTLFVDLGNAYIKTSQREKAVIAYQKALELIDESKVYRNKIIAQIDRLNSSSTIGQLPILRPDNVE